MKCCTPHCTPGQALHCLPARSSSFLAPPWPPSPLSPAPPGSTPSRGPSPPASVSARLPLVPVGQLTSVRATPLAATSVPAVVQFKSFIWKSLFEAELELKYFLFYQGGREGSCCSPDRDSINYHEAERDSGLEGVIFLFVLQGGHLSLLSLLSLSSSVSANIY